MRVGQAKRRRFLAGALASFVGLFGAAALASRTAAQPVDPPADSPWVPEPEAPAPPAAEPEGEFVPSGVRPAKLAIPKLGVEAPIVGVAQDEDGTMSAPQDPDEVAWYTLGPGMGVAGNAVFAGHVDWGGRLRVFGRLFTLEAGDAVLVMDENGSGYEYVVESARWLRGEGAPVDEIFDQTDSRIITLITCGGEYRAASREYLDRLVVRAKWA